MINPYIYIDDSGSPGINTQNIGYSSSTKLYIAIIIKASQKGKIEKKLFKELNRLKKQYNGIKEFHTKYIYTDSSEFENLTVEERLRIFEKMVQFYNEFRFPIIYSAISKEAIINSGYSENLLKDKIDNFTLSKAEDFALMTLIGKCDANIIKNRNKYGSSAVPKVIVDEGRQKSGTKQSIKFSADIIKEIEYEKSENEILLQFVDFLAFVINRCQINFAKQQSNFDKAFMKIIGRINYNMQGDFMKISRKKIDDMKREDYIKNVNKVKESRKKEEPIIKQLVDGTNKNYEAIENLKKYMDSNHIKHP